ncbi:EF-hand calcium-binding domain protein, putative [Trichophyton verrucosum HKI 0517]|uniref:EF-hand calcium-binding domain protein, putative n=1 Tax=Trichophyton verrucosum (strain HKI 0517) TaxID=663202 RepID=D4CZ28_TRIVH|nr:EF-hand calcium-binding domain protein, putative [Trichophyton verrucosum HKI 0517]EFE45127.1 EF-hand calcium-binding domain protein, putative [Trichophyton verrucosum HKI 0517]
MRILALHGLGSSSSLLKEQLTPFSKALGREYRFIFLDGGIPCERGPVEMRQALNYLDNFIREHGPFDGVFGFSLGAALAITYMLDQQNKQASSPFCFAVMSSSIFVVSPDDSFCEQLLRRWLADDHAAFRSKFPNGDFMTELEDPSEQKLAQYLQQVLSMQSMGVGLILPNTNVDFLGTKKTEEVPRLVHPDLLNARIKIPTVHVTGRHDGGHDVPFKISDVNAIVSLIKEMAEEGTQIRDLYDD